MTYAKLLGWLLCFLLGLAAGSLWHKYHQTQDNLARQKEQNALLVEHNLKLATANQKNLQLQNQIDLLSTQATRELHDALSENDRLAADLAVSERMRLKGSYCPRTDPGSDPAGAGQPGDGAGVELGEETRRLVWDLRRELIQDQQDILYLREYVRRLRATNPE